MTPNCRNGMGLRVAVPRGLGIAIAAYAFCLAQTAQSQIETGAKSTGQAPAAAELQKRIDALEHKLTARVRAVRNLLEHLRSAEEARRKLQTQCDELRDQAATMSAHEQTLATLRTDITAARGRIKALEAECAELKAKAPAGDVVLRSVHDRQVEELRRKLDESQQQTTALQAQLKGLRDATVPRKEHEQKTKQLQDALTVAEEKTQAIQAKIPTDDIVLRRVHNEKVGKLQRNLESGNNTIKRLEEQIELLRKPDLPEKTHNEQLARLQHALTTAEKRADALASDLTEAKTKARAEDAALKSLHEKAETRLREELTNAGVQTKTLETTLKALRETTVTRKEHTEKVAALQNALTEIEALVQTRNAQITVLQAKTPREDVVPRRVHEEQTAKLRVELAGSVARTAAFEDQLATVRAELEKAQGELDRQRPAETERITDGDVRFLQSEVAGLEARVADLTDPKQAAQLRQGLIDSQKMVLLLRHELARLRRERHKVSPEQQPLITSHFEKAKTAEQERKPEAAVWHYEQILKLDPYQINASIALGRALVVRGQDQEAEEVLSRALVLVPDDVRVLKLLGYACLRQEKAELAASMFTRALALGEEDANLRQHLGVACRCLGWTVGAERSFERAFRLDSSCHEAALNLAMLLATLETPRTAEAREWYARARDAGSDPHPGLEAFFAQHPPKESE